MFRRLPAIVALSLGMVFFSVVATRAQYLTAWPASLQVTPHTSTFAGTQFPLLSAQQIQRAVQVPEFRPTGSSRLMTSLYASTVLMQALDVHSSLTAFRS